jgi:hypothetical protein
MTNFFNKLITPIIVFLIVVITVIIIAFAVISFPAVYELFKYDFGSCEFNALIEGNRLKHLPYFAASVAALIALLTYLREKAKLREELDEKRSKIFLDLAKEGLESVYDMLKDQNNNRITWIRASRDMLHAINLANEIRNSHYLEAYHQFEEKIRHKLYIALTTFNQESGKRKSLPPQFFYGVSNWKEEKPLDEVAKETSDQIIVNSPSIDHNNEEPQPIPLSEKSVVAIFNFLKYPDDYDDPLVKVKIWDENWDFSRGEFQGAARFVSHITSHRAFNGKLYSVDKQNK